MVCNLAMNDSYMLDFLQPHAEQSQVLVPLEHAQLDPHPQAMMIVVELEKLGLFGRRCSGG